MHRLLSPNYYTFVKKKFGKKYKKNNLRSWVRTRYHPLHYLRQGSPNGSLQTKREADHLFRNKTVLVSRHIILNIMYFELLWPTRIFRILNVTNGKY